MSVFPSFADLIDFIILNHAFVSTVSGRDLNESRWFTNHSPLSQSTKAFLLPLRIKTIFVSKQAHLFLLKFFEPWILGVGCVRWIGGILAIAPGQITQRIKMWRPVQGFVEYVSVTNETVWQNITDSLKENFYRKISSVYWNVRFTDLNCWWYLWLLIEATMQAERFKLKNQTDFVY